MGLLPPAQAQGLGGSVGSWWEAPGDFPFSLHPQSGASSPPTRSAYPSMALMFPLSSLAQSSSWGDCCSSALSPGFATCRVSLGQRAGDMGTGQAPGPELVAPVEDL